ncbi:MAG: UDP-N-acetylmuramoyl-L-alanine--D-glutamate ligase [Butyrivibrio sp.]|nr:UDP-N-acetylmuramoyl-L-alanine--D-glutamate ligase [Butyrivibrio sp.]
MNLEGKKVLVVGTGVSGVGAAGLLEKVGAGVVLYDGNGKLDRNAVLAKLPSDSEAEIIIGELPEDVLSEVSLAVISPGVPIDSPIVRRFEAAGIPVWGEIELAYNYEKGTVYAITGTNGKTTTTTLFGEIMRAFNEKTFVVGNIGTSYTGETLKTEPDSVTVAEISSFQLETVHAFAPRGTAILNITPDHLDRHYTMENYIAVKESITRNQGSDGFCVLNYDDGILREFGKTLPNPVYFSRKTRPEKGAYLDKTMIKYTDGTNDTDIIDVNDMFIFGSHNYENVMAAAALAINAGVPVKLIADTIRQFKGVEHRIEFVREMDGVVYYNDSKGTNPDSSIKALEAMTRPTLLIAGGYDKHSEFDGFLEAFGGKVKLMVLMGATAPQLEKTALAHGFDRIRHAKSLEEAVKICAENAKDGDAVLLSPACASWDMFKSYEQRGELFKEYVRGL